MSASTISSISDNLTDCSDDNAAKDARLRDDIRLLGRILGDTVRDQEGLRPR